MKKIALFLFVSVGILGLAAVSHAAFPPVQDMGAVSTGTTLAVSIGTAPALILSTGTNMFMEQRPSFTVPQTTATVVTQGNYMQSRVHIEFFNDTGQDVWLGHTVNISSNAGSNYGRRVPDGAAWSHDCSIVEHYGLAATVTPQKFVITQER